MTDKTGKHNRDAVLASMMADIRQGQSSTPRCEPPSEYDIKWCADRIKEVRKAEAALMTDKTDSAAHRLAGERAGMLRAVAWLRNPAAKGSETCLDWAEELADMLEDVISAQAGEARKSRTPSLADRERIFANEPYDPPCNVPPEGWYCTRKPGHDGPCAAYPAGEAS